ncbi:MAG: hypothetical protein NTY37_06265 [Methanothrix sp.]|nr:hypothetical protein [Methanothrix sp.]
MKFKKLENRSVPLGKMLLFCCITLGLMTALSAAAAPEKDVCTGAEMGSYAKLVFCLPPQVVVEPETMAEANYTGGKAVAASMLLDGNRVGLHLLYPCIAPQKELKPAELKPFLEAYNSVLAQSKYNDSVTGPVLWGQVGNQIFVAYQPNNLTIALVMMDMNMSEKMMTAFLGNLSITLNEGTTPLTPGYCPETTVAPATATAQNNATPSLVTDNEVTPAETRKENLATGKEKMASDMAAARAKLEAAREKMRRS